LLITSADSLGSDFLFTFFITVVQINTIDLSLPITTFHYLITNPKPDPNPNPKRSRKKRENN